MPGYSWGVLVARMRHGVCEGLMVRQDEELPPLQKVTEVANSYIVGQQLSVKGTILPLGKLKPLTEKSDGCLLLVDCPYIVCRGVSR